MVNGIELSRSNLSSNYTEVLLLNCVRRACLRRVCICMLVYVGGVGVYSE